MISSSIHILMTGAGAPGAAGIIQCLKQDPAIQLTVADADPEAVGRYLHEAFVRIPEGDAPGFADVVLQICQEKKIQLILPLVTRELLSLARNKARFEQEGIRVLVSSEQAISIAANKSACYRFLQDKGIRTPSFFVVRTPEEFMHAAFELGHPQKAFCFKPSLSNGSRGVRIVSDSLDETEQVFYHKPYHLMITYPHALSILSSKPFPELLVSEYLPGEEHSVDCLADHGVPSLVIPRTRKKMVNGISVKGEFVRDEAIMDYCRSIIKAMELHGNIGIQVKRSESGEPLLLEVNPRVQGTIVSALGAGVNLPLLGVKQELGLGQDAQEHQIKWGTRFSRYWTEIYY